FLKTQRTTAIYTLSLHDALPILIARSRRRAVGGGDVEGDAARACRGREADREGEARRAGVAFVERHIVDGQVRQHDSALRRQRRSEEHTSELQSRSDLVCRLLLE